MNFNKVACAAVLLYGSVAFTNDIAYKAQHTLNSSSSVWGVAKSKNSTGKSNMLSVVQNSNSAISFTAPTLSLSAPLIDMGSKMTNSATITAGTSGTVSFPEHQLNITGDNNTMTYTVDGTPDVGTGVFAATIECCCEQSGCEEMTTGWFECGTVTSEAPNSQPEAVDVCMSETAYTPMIRARRDGAMSWYLTFPF